MQFLRISLFYTLVFFLGFESSKVKWNNDEENGGDNSKNIDNHQAPSRAVENVKNHQTVKNRQP